MTTIFHRILDCRSLTVLDYLCEDALATTDHSQGERETLQRILKTNCLDERWALAHEHLGQHDKAAELRQWIAGAGERRRKAQLQSQQLFETAD